MNHQTVTSLNYQVRAQGALPLFNNKLTLDPDYSRNDHHVSKMLLLHSLRRNPANERALIRATVTTI